MIALELRYRTQGNQREMTDTVKYYFDELYLEKLEHRAQIIVNIAPVVDNQAWASRFLVAMVVHR